MGELIRGYQVGGEFVEGACFRAYAFNHQARQVFQDGIFQLFTKAGDLLEKAGAGVSLRWTISLI